MASGGVRADFAYREFHITPYENRPLGWQVVDGNGDPVTDFTGWEADLWILRDLGPNGPDELTEAAVLALSETNGLALSGPPIIAWLTRDEDWDVLGTHVREWWYELWKTSAPRDRLAWGRIVVGA